MNTRAKKLAAFSLSFAVIVLIFSIWFSGTQAAIPKKLTIQGRLDQGGSLADGNYAMVFKIYDVSSGGTALYTESHTGSNKVAVHNGFFKTTLGDLTALNLDFDVPYWLGITIESDSEISPRIELTSSSYAMKAGGLVMDENLNVDSGTLFVDISNNKVGIGTASPSYKLDVSGIVNATQFYQGGSPLVSGYWTQTGSDIYYNTGNVGIGTASPGEALDVVGSGKFSGTLGLNGAVQDVSRGINYSASNPSANSYGIYNTLNTGSGYDVYGVYNLLTADDGGYDSAFGVYNKLITSATNNTKAYGTYVTGYGTGGIQYGNYFTLNDADVTKYGFYSQITTGKGVAYQYSVNTGTSSYSLTPSSTRVYGTQGVVSTTDDASTQTAYAHHVQLKTHSGAGDAAYGLYVGDYGGLSTGGTQYGVYIDLDDANVTNYAIYVPNSDSGDSYFGDQVTFNSDNYFPGSGIWNSSGNVGIGTTSPGAKLDVAGNIHATGNVLTDSGAGTFVPLSSPVAHRWSCSANTAINNITPGGSIPSNAKALYVKAFAFQTAGNIDHVAHLFGPNPISGTASWSNSVYDNYTTDWGSFAMFHEGDSAGNANYYGAWDNGIINLNSSGQFNARLCHGWSSGTHTIVLQIWGYWI